MALSQVTLKNALINLMENQRTTDPVQAAAHWAQAFDTYGAQARNINGDGPLVPPNQIGFQAALTFLGPAPQTATEFAAAWAAYFAGLTFAPGPPGAVNAGPCANIGGNSIFGVIATSVVTVVNPAPLALALTAHFATFLGTDSTAAADALASIFHNHTINVLNLAVLTTGLDTTPPAGGPLPITNLCGVA